MEGKIDKFKSEIEELGFCVNMKPALKSLSILIALRSELNSGIDLAIHLLFFL